MRYGSVCSGIEAATVAWHSLGWQPAFFSEIDKFPCAVLAHHYPTVPCHGDFTTIGADEYGAIDLLVGGTPCQSFSIAGLRKGLDDDRGNLALEFVRLAQRKRPRWVVWENVPGCLSIDGGRAFGSILAGLGECGYGFAYRVLDAQYFGVPQRRERVFVVGCLGSWQRAASVLFERESLRGDITPRREAGQTVAAYSPSSIGGYSEGCGTLRAQGGDIGGGSETLICHIDYEMNCRTPDKAMGSLMKGSPTGGGHQIPAVLMQHIDGGHTARTLTARYDGSVTHDRGPDIVAVPLNLQVITRHEALGEGTGFGLGIDGDPAYTLSANHCHGVACFQQNQLGEVRESDVMCTLNTNSNASGRNTPLLRSGMTVRKLTPTECERLQGFPDGYTLVPYRGGHAADGPRYRAIGNSMAVPVMRWLGERIQKIEAMG